MERILKPGVDFREVEMHPRMLEADILVRQVFFAQGYPTVITSAIREHSVGSLHAEGKAVDYRTRHVPAYIMKRIHQIVISVLGGEFDVVLKDSPPHLHVEYDPD